MELTERVTPQNKSNVQCSGLNATRKIPLEVMEHIIDALHSSGHTPSRLDHCKDISERRIVDKTLRSCALTCRALLPRSQVVLYWCIHIDDVESEVDAGGELGQFRRPREALRRLASALSTYPHLAPLIKTITACDGLYGSNGREDPVSNTFPIILARVRLPNLTAVRLVSGFWRGDLWRDVMVVSPAYLGTLSRLSGLGHLELSAVMFENFASFRRILVVLPSLSSLFLRNIQFRTGWSSPHLTTMPGQSKLPRITRLKLQLPNFEGSSSSCWVYVLLVRLAPSLERLTLVTQYSLMMTCTDPDSPSGCIAFPNLTSVTFRILQGGAAVVLPFFRDTTDLTTYHY